MSSFNTLALEFKDGESPDWNSEVPEWIRDGAITFNYSSNYLYVKFRGFEFNGEEHRGIEGENVLEKISEDMDSVERVMFASWNDTVDKGRFILYRLVDGNFRKLEEILSQSFYKAFEPKVESLEDYFDEEYNFECKLYRGWLSDNGGYFKLEDERTKHR